MACAKAIAIFAVLALAVVANAQTTQEINKLIPLTIKISSKGAGKAVVTETLNTSPTVCSKLSDLFLNHGGDSLVFYGEAIEEAVSEVCSSTFYFDKTSLEFFKRLAHGGENYEFKGAYLVFPDDDTTYDLHKNEVKIPIEDHSDETLTVSIKSLTATIYNPHVAIRLDYRQTNGGDCTQYVSLYYTDKTTGSGSLTTANLVQAYGIYGAPGFPFPGPFYPGQGTANGK